MERNFKGIWIPAEIWLSKELTLQEKVFLVEIDSLDNNEGCFARNSYFAEFFGISKARVSQVIKSLEEKGYISSTLEYTGREVSKRIIKCLPPSKFSKEGSKYSKQGSKFSKGGYLENYKDNNTIYNNIDNNTINSSSSIDHHQLEEKEYVKKYVSVFPTCCSVDLEILSSYEEQGMEDAVICMAIEEAVRNNVRRLRYIETILQNWLNNNIKTVIQLEAYKNQRKEKGGVNNGPNSKNNGTTEATEDFFNGKLKEF